MEFVLGIVDGGTVGVEDVVFGLDLEGLGEFLTGDSLLASPQNFTIGGVVWKR